MSSYIPRTPVQDRDDDEDDDPSSGPSYIYQYTQRMPATPSSPSFLPRTPRQYSYSSENAEGTPQQQTPDREMNITQVQSSPEHHVLFTQVQSSPEPSPSGELLVEAATLPQTPIQIQDADEDADDIEEDDNDNEKVQAQHQYQSHNEADDEQDFDTSTVSDDITNINSPMFLSQDLLCGHKEHQKRNRVDEDNDNDEDDDDDEDDDEVEDSDASTVIGEFLDSAIASTCTVSLDYVNDSPCEDFGNDDGDNQDQHVPLSPSPSPPSHVKSTMTTAAPPLLLSSIDVNMQQWIQSIHDKKNAQQSNAKKSTDESDEDSIAAFSPTPKKKSTNSSKQKSRQRSRQSREKRQSNQPKKDQDQNSPHASVDDSDAQDPIHSFDERKHEVEQVHRRKPDQRHQSTNSLSLRLSFPSTSSTTTRLHRHQRKAVEWMLSREAVSAVSLSGGILADDCGLGKTMTALTLISHTAQQRSDCRAGTLVICPSACIDQWSREIRRHTNLIPLIYHGKRRSYKISDNPYNFVTNYDVVIASFNTVCSKEIKSRENAKDIRASMQENKGRKRGGVAEWISRGKNKGSSTCSSSSSSGRSGRSGSSGRSGRSGSSGSSGSSGNSGNSSIISSSANNANSYLHCVEWSRVIVDEAHDITNKRTKRHKCIDELSSLHRWGLTATPMGNSTKELRTLLEWIGRANNSSKDALQLEAEIEQCMTQGACRQPSRSVVMLRRLKGSTGTKDVRDENENENENENKNKEGENENEDCTKKGLHLPLREETVVHCSMREGSIQKMIYDRLIQKTIQLSIGKTTGKQNIDKKQQLHVFELLLRLRQVVNHPTLISNAVNKGNKKLRRALRRQLPLNAENEEEDILNSDRKTMARPRARDSTKVRALLRLTKEWKLKKESFVIFSQWTSFLDVCRCALADRGYKMEYIDGDLTSKEKSMALMRCGLIRENVRVDGMLVSIRAGGVGLNMTCFKHVILLEPNYNPSVEEQCIGRIHRMGSRYKKISVTRFITKSTIEDDIVRIQQRKQREVNALMTNEDAVVSDQEIICELMQRTN